MIRIHIHDDNLWIYSGEVIVLDGERGSGKTTTALWLAYCIQKLINANVLFASSDNRKKTLVNRQNDLCIPPMPIIFLTRCKIAQEKREEALKKLARRCRRMKCSIVVFDSLHTCFPSESAKEEIATLELIRKFALNSRAYVIVTTNTRDYEIDIQRIKDIEGVRFYKVWSEQEQDEDSDIHLLETDSRAVNTCIHLQLKA